MFSQWGLVGTGNKEQGTSQSSEARHPAGPPEAKLQKKIGGGNPQGNREQGTGNRGHAVFPKCSLNMFRNHSGKTHRCLLLFKCFTFEKILTHLHRSLLTGRRLLKRIHFKNLWTMTCFFSHIFEDTSNRRA